MLQLIQDSTRHLIKHRSNLCVSLFIPMDSRDSVQAHFLRLWNDARDRASVNYGDDEVQSVFSRLHVSEVISKVNTDYDTLCLFASAYDAFFVYLDLKMDPKAVVDSSFFLTPLILPLSGKDQAWIVEVTDANFVLSLISLSGVITFATAPRLRAHKKATAQLKYIVRVLNTDRRPWFIGGGAEHVQSAQLELTRALVRRSPVAHLLHTRPSRLHESAREVIRRRFQMERDAILSRLHFMETTPLEPADLMKRELAREEFRSLIVDISGRNSFSDEYSKILARDEGDEELDLDDSIEEALANRMDIIPAPFIEKKIGTRILALRRKGERTC